MARAKWAEQFMKIEILLGIASGSTLNLCRFRLLFKAWINISLGARRALKDLDLRDIDGLSSKSMILN